MRWQLRSHWFSSARQTLRPLLTYAGRRTIASSGVENSRESSSTWLLAESKTHSFNGLLCGMAEVAGLVFGVIPIFATAMQHFRALHRLCIGLKKYDEEVEDLFDILDCQRGIFVNETMLILSAAVGKEVAKAMVNDLDHPSWTAPRTEARLELVLEDSKETIKMAAKNLSDKLAKMEERLARLHTRSESDTMITWKRGKVIWRRLDFACSKNKIHDLMESIVKATERYRVLRAQRQDLTNCKAIEDTDTFTSEEREQLETIRDAAKHLYERLLPACNIHLGHHAWFGLQSTYNVSGGHTAVNFQLAYRLPRRQIECNEQVLWFAVDAVAGSARSSTLKSPPDQMITKPVVGTKRCSSSTTMTLQATIAARSKRVRILSPSIIRHPPPPASVPQSESNGQSIGTSLPDLITTAGLCNALQACCINNSVNGAFVG